MASTHTLVVTVDPEFTEAIEALTAQVVKAREELHALQKQSRGITISAKTLSDLDGGDK